MERIDTTLEMKAVALMHIVQPLISILASEFDIGDGFYIGGGALGAGERHDIDLFFERLPQDSSIAQTLDGTGFTFIHATPNAVTVYSVERQETIQLCKYWKESAQELAESFDFAHIQAAAAFSLAGDNVAWFEELHYTDEWVQANALAATWYTGSEFPLSSMARLSKYTKYGVKVYVRYSVIKILRDILARAPYSHEQWLEQLNAIDILMLNEDEQEGELGQLALQVENMLATIQGRLPVMDDEGWLDVEF